jgi:hypothetical protein
MSCSVCIANRQKEADKVWKLIVKGKYVQSMHANMKLKKKSRRWFYKPKISYMSAFQEALIAQLSLTLENIPKSEPHLPKYEVDQQICQLLKQTASTRL